MLIEQHVLCLKKTNNLFLSLLDRQNIFYAIILIKFLYHKEIREIFFIVKMRTTNIKTLNGKSLSYALLSILITPDLKHKHNHEIYFIRNVFPK